MAELLIVDDDEALCRILSKIVVRMGHRPTEALTLDAGLKASASTAFDVVFLDVRLPDGNGLEALPEIQNTPGAPDIIIITGEGDPDGAEMAIRSGAWAYIEKPFSIEQIRLQLLRVMQYRSEKAVARPPMMLKREGIVGSSTQIEACFELTAKIANSDVAVFITGETGTGKELFAKAIHENSNRAKKNFVVVDCASLPETLVASILFGHERGAFTDAQRARVGLIKEADGGTLFLDEVGELPLEVQKDFLRVLQENRFRPIGSSREIESNFRLVSATNRNLREMVDAGQFRRDLYYRLKSMEIELPALRHRTTDIKDLASHYMVKFCERYETETKGFSPDFFDLLVAYDWPGNVRELIHTMERVLTIARFEPTLFARHLPVDIRIHAARSALRPKAGGPEKVVNGDVPEKRISRLQDVRNDVIAKVEKQYLHDLMLITRKNINAACQMAGISKSRLYHLLQKYEISRT